MIHAASLSDETKRDGAVAPNLIREVGEINSLITDSGYDEIKVYQTALEHMKPDGKIIIHPSQMQLYQQIKRLLYVKEISMWKRYNPEASLNGEKPLDITNKVKLKTHFIDIKQSLEII